jgi:hypothetical protein
VFFQLADNGKQMEGAMRGPAISMAVACVIVFLGCGAVCAQTTTPSIGGSQLGSEAPSNAPFQSNIPLGATELTPSGLSPFATTACPDFTGTSVGLVGSATQNPTFDGGGLTGGATSTLDCAEAGAGAAPGAAASALSASTGVTAGLGSGLGGASIQLGATELGTPGESAPLSLSVPAASTLPCAGVSGAPIMTTLPGISSPNGC